MDTSSLKGDKWKMISLALIGVFILILVGSFLQNEYRHPMLREGKMVQLTESEIDIAIEIATLALEDRITDDYIPTTRDNGFQVKDDSGETHKITTVAFTSGTSEITYRVVVDLEDGQAITIIEHRGSSLMEQKGPPHFM